MIVFILKFSACLLIFMLFYKLLLEQLSIHQFKRFYLLGAIVASIAIPLFTIVEYIEPSAISEFETLEVVPNIDHLELNEVEERVNYLPFILWSIYGIGAIVFLLKFSRNLTKIISRIKYHTKHKYEGFINVLLLQPITPHTFFNYIFLNKRKYDNAEIPKEVLLHEQTHAKQMHSIDVVFLEILQIVFWFNPLIYLLKRDIKLNHEFLADRAVLHNGTLISTYQELLLEFTLSSTNTEMANAINYPSIKKRFTIMKTQTSKLSIWLRSLMILPLLAILFYSFTEHIQVEKETIASITSSNPIQPESMVMTSSSETTSSEVELYLNQKGELFYNDKIIEIDDLASIYKLENDMNISLKTTLNVNKDITSSVTKRIQKYLRDQGLSKFSVCVVAEKENEQDGATSEQLEAYNAWAKKINTAMKNAKAKNSKSAYPIVKKKEVDYYSHIYNNVMSETQRKNAEPFPDFPPPPPPAPEKKRTLKQKYQKSNEVVRVNGKTPVEDQIGLSTKEAFGFKLSLKDAKVINFKLKVPGQPSRTITGNALDEEGKVLLRKLPKKGAFQLFDIKDSKGFVHPPIIVSINE